MAAVDYEPMEQQPTGCLDGMRTAPWGVIGKGTALMIGSYIVLSIINFFVHGVFFLLLLALIMLVALMLLRRLDPDTHAKVQGWLDNAKATTTEGYSRHVQPRLSGAARAVVRGTGEGAAPGPLLA
mmetsp:Transcript_6706/g.14483  ORF Transcript_6706/g.14483 Transcript_6706/m.14483 type:complete len:126 (+) Transcript_6706:64-441(+)|eukprot:CAMPEP_0204252444 /NCGR_PEP_ID=MMETSP0468-20130131/1192_1 /ASSEMBLY_ACC=CAM_ASM_000383 /TAXON_ID=2969 /ORGANISM="Oxyrrhis marina" /LENGTH=125 /DNA_ID=CAMNT_0051225879 /DNA_START=64 /DNA_END=441 /DNA_ORIENTATION=+